MVRVGRGVWGDAGGIDATFKGMGDTWEVTPGSVPLCGPTCQAHPDRRGLQIGWLHMGR